MPLDDRVTRGEDPERSRYDSRNKVVQTNATVTSAPTSLACLLTPEAARVITGTPMVARESNPN
eukprot:1290044-Amphidinium_carterae.1